MPEPSLNPRELTWAALLGRWIEFARASVALPDDDEGERWRQSVTPIVNLQAVTMALGELADLDRGERELGVDKADLLVRQAGTELNRIWRGVAFPEQLSEIAADAGAALRRARSLADLLICESEAVAPDCKEAQTRLLADGFTGTLYTARPGTRLAPGAPLAWAQRGDLGPLLKTVAPDLPGADLVTGRACQVMRLASERGEPIEDVAVDLDAEPIAGLPLLIVAIERGERVSAARAQSFGAVRQDVLDASVPFRLALDGDTKG
jgi:hypothetical protein